MTFKRAYRDATDYFAVALVGSGCLIPTLVILACIGGWFQHLYTCFVDGAYGFLIAGALFAPIAVMHGWAIWVGIV